MVGKKRGKEGSELLQVHISCEIPLNVRSHDSVEEYKLRQVNLLVL